jgi:hypothetical protein
VDMVYRMLAKAEVVEEEEEEEEVAGVFLL